MKTGTLFGIGVGPGDSDLITVKGAKILGECRHVFVPKSREDAESVAMTIAAKYVNPQAKIHQILFPMTTDGLNCRPDGQNPPAAVAEVLETGADACFLTLGDTFLYSTYIYMLQALRDRIPKLNVVTIPGITAFSAAAALPNSPVGKAKEPVTIVPTADDLDAVQECAFRWRNGDPHENRQAPGSDSRYSGRNRND